MNVKILPICLLISLTTMVLNAQTLSREDYRIQVRKAMEAADTTCVGNLLLSQRSEAIRFIESLLDSAMINQADGKIDVGFNDWRRANKLAYIYANVFGDNFYLEKSSRYREFKPYAVAQKVEIIHLKKQGKQYFYQGNFKGAGEIFEQALSIAEVIGDVDDEASIIGAFFS